MYHIELFSVFCYLVNTKLQVKKNWHKNLASAEGEVTVLLFFPPLMWYSFKRLISIFKALVMDWIVKCFNTQIIMTVIIHGS